MTTSTKILLQIDEKECRDIWTNIHDNMNNYQVQSSMWELIHRNYMCAYFAKLVFNNLGNCKLCGKLEQKRTHIFLNCDVAKMVIRNFEYILLPFHSEVLSVKEMTFGVLAKGKIENRIHNYILYTIRHTLFRSRNTDYHNINNAVSSITNKTNKIIRNYLKNKFYIAFSKNATHKFAQTYLYNNILGKIEGNAFETKL